MKCKPNIEIDICIYIYHTLFNTLNLFLKAGRQVYFFFATLLLFFWLLPAVVAP